MNGTVQCYGHRGNSHRARHEVSVPRNQSGAASFTPMRLYLPYGKWTCADGTEVLFNRDYSPLWARTTDGKVFALDPDTWIKHKSSHHYFDDGSGYPWGNKAVLDRCLDVLKEWGVENRHPHLLDMLQDVIRTGNVDMLQEKNTSKQFPATA